MTRNAEYAPSPESWVRDQVALYEATGGREGNTLRGKPVVIVTSTGARSGKIRKTPLMRVEHDGRYALVASQGGAPKHPTWYFNLVADPRIRSRTDRTRGTWSSARSPATRRPQWWERAVAAWPDYAEYAERTDREIPVFLAEPV